MKSWKAPRHGGKLAATDDANLKPHHHFVCNHCGAVEDIDWFDVPELPRSHSGRRRI